MENEIAEICIVCGGKEPCSHDFDKMKQELEKIFSTMGTLNEFQPHVSIDVANQRLTIFLEDCSHYAEWIDGEGADIAIYRAMDDKRVVGAALPLRKWNGKLPVFVL